MSEELKRYNHLQYKDENNASDDGFINFLYRNTELVYPEIDESKAWDRLANRIAESNSNKKSMWIKIAASIAIIISVGLAVYFIDSDPNLVLVASSDENVSVTFPDGSTGVLNANSEFSYPESFGLERNVSFSGEAYFDILKSKKPFIINANGVDVKVLGTAFNLITSEKEVKLYVDRGLVAFSYDGTETKVSAGSEAIFNKETNKVFIKDIPSTNIMSWRNGSFKFDNTPFQNAIKDLEEYYEVEFKLGNDNLKNCRITASISGKSIEEVLTLIESILDVRTKLRDNTVKISGKGC